VCPLLHYLSLSLRWGGNNGSTVTGGIIANREGISWNTKAGVKNPNYFGSITQASTINVGTAGGAAVYVPFKSLLPMVNPNDLVIGGWDINNVRTEHAVVVAFVSACLFCLPCPHGCATHVLAVLCKRADEHG